MTLQLHDYQCHARDFLRAQHRAALFLDMGLGKTATSLCALTPDHLPALVVAPKRVAEHVWQDETARWRPDLTCRVAKGGPAARRAALADLSADVVAIGRDNLRDVLTVKRRWNTVILDELSGFKTKSSVRWKTANKIITTHQPLAVWGLTGTPAPNGLMDLWAQVALLDQGQRLGKNLTQFRSRYYTPGRRLPNGIVIEWLLRPGAADAIKRKVQDICLAMATDGRITLPPVTYNDIRVDLPPAARQQYRTFEQDLVVTLHDLFGPATVHTAANAAAMTARLSQLTSGFMYVDEAAVNDYRYTEVHTTKIQALQEIVEASQGSPLLVFYRFKAELEMLQRAFPDSWTVDDKDVFAKWNRGEVPMLLAHPASAGHGLNLQHGGHTIVWTSPTWNLEEYQQANKRLARQGQKHPVVIHHILAKGTVDALVRRRLTEKADVQFDLLEFLESPL